MIWFDAATDARLVAFNQRKDDILRHLHKSKTGSFDPDRVWHTLRLDAWQYLGEEARANEDRMRTPAAVHIERLCRLGNILEEARQAFDEVKRHDDSELFSGWCEKNFPATVGSTHYIEQCYDDLTADLIASLTDIGISASLAAEQLRQKRGRPPEISVRQTTLIVNLERTYRGVTGKPGGAGPGPFAQFVAEFLDALGRPITESTVIKAIKTARKSPKWGR
jgi:hypothetical protein